MKKQYSLIAFFLAFSMMSCEKTDGELLVGKLEFDTTTSTYYKDGVFMNKEKMPKPSSIYVHEYLSNRTVKFSINGPAAGTAKWEVSGNVIIYTYSSGETAESNFTVNKQTLTRTTANEETREGIVYKTVYLEVFHRI